MKDTHLFVNAFLRGEVPAGHHEEDEAQPGESHPVWASADGGAHDPDPAPAPFDGNAFLRATWLNTLWRRS